ncbi:DNA-binding protein [Actinomadura xylanilytica]|uniref:DNA-binding protein n=1 Tax=Actinomadura xylanilytica TaxID=887459 RepID=UPI00255B0C17|nr:DNA-binding protein [Actinomadura xylanilytica]MDL4777430.1 DNA-binding protein [Actinomadura xylanilytica]
MASSTPAEFLDLLNALSPKDVARARLLLPDVEQTLREIRRRAWNRPKKALRDYQAIADELAPTVPAALPALYEHAALAFLSAQHEKYAAQMLAAARQAEAEHGLLVDADHIDEIFTQFAVAGALPAKAVADYAKELAGRMPADQAFQRFARLCVRCTEKGDAPSTQMAAAVRRLAKAAGDQAALEQAYLAEMVACPAIVKAPAGWWNAHKTALTALARRDPEVGRTLLDMVPGYQRELSLQQIRDRFVQWLELLERSGATAALGDVTDRPRPSGGTAGWLDTVLEKWNRGIGGNARLPGLGAVVERVAGRLRDELAASGGTVRVPHDIDLLDLLLTLDVPVAGPDPGHRLDLDDWAAGDERRDLRALAADPRFTAAFAAPAGGFVYDQRNLRTVELLAETPGGRSLVLTWVRDVFRQAHAPGLPGLVTPHNLLEWLPTDILAAAVQDGPAGAPGGDLVAEIVRTLRGGLFGELCWPAFEEAVREVMAGSDWSAPRMQDAWPYLIVSGDSEVRVVGPEGTVLAHTFPDVPGSWISTWYVHYVDGALQVTWRDFKNHCLVGYWHVEGTPDAEPIPMTDIADRYGDVSLISGEWRRGLSPAMTLPLPGGGRTTGEAVLRPGDTRVPAENLVIGDGTSFWVRKSYPDRWVAYDPITGSQGAKGLPAQLTSMAEKASGTVVPKHTWLRPAGTAETTPLGTPVDGLLGWLVTEHPDGSVRGEDLAGRSVTVADPPRSGGEASYPVGALSLPGDDRPRVLLRNNSAYGPAALIDPDGVTTALSEGHFAAGLPHLPPQAYWTMLRPRDPEGSAALRRVDRETAAALFKASVSGDDDLPALVRTLIPQIGDDTLAMGVAGVARFAAERQAVLDGVAARIAGHTAQDDAPSAPDVQHVQDALEAGPDDAMLGNGLSGLWLGRYSERLGAYRLDGDKRPFDQLRALHRALHAEPIADVPDGRTHIGGPELPKSHVAWDRLLGGCAAVALRAASPATPPREREALRRLLVLVNALGLDSSRPGHWRQVGLHLPPEIVTEAIGQSKWADYTSGICALLPLADGAFLAVLDATNGTFSVGTKARLEYGCDFTALFHDPSGRFEVPAPYTVTSSVPVGEDREPGWLGAFLTAWAEHGQIARQDAAAEEFAELTGAVPALAGLLLAGLPELQDDAFPSSELRGLLEIKQSAALVARGDIARHAGGGLPAAVTGALLPEDPARLWTHGPDAAAAARVWNATVGRKRPIPEDLLSEAAKAVVRSHWSAFGRAWGATDSIRALVEPSASPHLTTDLSWRIQDVQVLPAHPDLAGFTEEVLVGTIAAATWLAHRLPAGDPLRASLPDALALIRDRLAAPGMLLELVPRFDPAPFRAAAGPPDETGGPTDPAAPGAADLEWQRSREGWQRYGAIIIPDSKWPTHPIVRTALLDETGDDPNLPLTYRFRDSSRITDSTRLSDDALAEALHRAFDPRFAALLADPGDPVAGERGKDGLWWPQDPARSVPDLVAEVAAAHGLGADAAGVYLALLALPDPTDRNVARWTGWKPARLKAARAELAASGLVVEGRRARAGRSLFLPGGWEALKTPHLPLETWKLPFFHVLESPLWGGKKRTALGAILPYEPVPGLFRRAWQRVQDGDAPA